MSLELSGLRKRFDETVAVDGVDLALGEGEILTLLGPSGCGKTTVLRLVAGFESPDDGRVVFRGTDVTGRPPQRRGFGMVFQHYALFPHLTAFENVAFGLRSRGEGSAAIGERVARALARVDLPGFGDRRVQEISGGQQQRVALARALAIEPPLLLLDEPLSNLDAALRERTRTELRLLIKELGITALYVTHDQEEAFDVSDRVAVMRAGRVRQVGTPEELYDRPADAFVAGFVGRANVLSAVLEERGVGPGRAPRDRERGEGTKDVVQLEGGARWTLPRAVLRGPGLAVAGPASDVALRLYLRPEDLALIPEPDGGGTGGLRGRVEDRRFQGAVTAYRVEVEDGPALEVWGDREAARPGDAVVVTLRREARIHAFPEGEG